MEPMKATSVNSRAEELFVQLFCEAFGPEKTENLQVQYLCVDIYGRHRYIDFALESPESKIAIEIDGETYHNPSKVSENKYADDLLKQNSLIYDNWKVYRWIYSQLEKQPEKVKDELITFLGTSPMFKAFEADLPVQMGQTIELRDYQQEATENLQKMREDGKTIALLYHATGVNHHGSNGCQGSGRTHAISGQRSEAGISSKRDFRQGLAGSDFGGVHRKSEGYDPDGHFCNGAEYLQGSGKVLAYRF